MTLNSVDRPIDTEARAADTVTIPEVPVIEEVTESVALMVWLPAVTRVALELKVCTPMSPAKKV